MVLRPTSRTLLLSRMKKKFKDPRWWSILAPGMYGQGVILIPKGLKVKIILLRVDLENGSYFMFDEKKY